MLISFARALLANTRILIIDEPTASPPSEPPTESSSNRTIQNPGCGRLITLLVNPHMKYTKIISVTILPLLFLTSCKSDDGTQTNDASSASKSEGKKVKLSDVIDASKALDVYKEEIGYKDSPEINALDQELTTAVFKLMDLRKDHPTLKKIAAEGDEAQAKLIEAVQNKDEAAKKKWGPLAAEGSLKRREAMKNIPELVALEKKTEELEAKIEQLRYDAIAKEPEGKKLANEVRRVTKAYTTR